MAEEHWKLTMSGHTSVKQFIRNVRAAKTIADERAVIQKESASIRASFREESHDHSVRCATTIVFRPLSSSVGSGKTSG